MGTWSITLLIVVAILILNAALWIGLFGQRHVGRGAPWWLMALGVVLLSVGPVCYWIGLPFFIGNYSGSGGHSMSLAGLMPGGLVATLLGALLFAAGYGFHGLKAAAAGRRLKELELLTVSLTEEVGELRRAGQKA